MDSFKIALAILLGILVSRIHCIPHNLKGEFHHHSRKDTIESNNNLGLRDYVKYSEKKEKSTLGLIQNLPGNVSIHQMKERIRVKTKTLPDYLTPPHLNPAKPPGRFSRQQNKPILKNSNADAAQDPVFQFMSKPNVQQPEEEIVNDDKLSNVFVNQVQKNSSPEGIVLKKVPQVQLQSEIGSSKKGINTLSDKDAELLKLIARIKLATAKEKIETYPEDSEGRKIQIGFKIPMPLATSLLGSAGILKGHLDRGKSHERSHYEPIPFFGKHNFPPSVPLELANQIRLQSDSYGPSFNPSYKEPYHGFLPVKLSPNSQYIEFPIEMYKTKFDPVPVSDNVYVNHQLGIGQKAGHVFPVKGSKSVFGYTRSSRFIGNIISH